jgi:hypothetical protein
MLSVSDKGADGSHEGAMRFPVWRTPSFRISHSKIGEHSGRVVKSTGDGLLAEFASVVDAVRCATKIQKAMPERSAEVAEDKRFHLQMAGAIYFLSRPECRVTLVNLTF